MSLFDSPLPSGLQTEVDVSLFSSFRTPARAGYFFEISERSHFDLLPAIYAFAEQWKLPVEIIGAGTNCLFAFDRFEGIMIHNRYTGWDEPFLHDGRKFVRVHSGELSNFVATKLYENFSISTLVPWVGLPGTFGGATVGNAGCFGVEMADIFVEAEVYDLERGVSLRYTLADMDFVYRSSALRGNPRYFVISTLIDLSPLGGEYETYTPTNLRSIRKVKQPIGISCGSFFKNPENAPSAGKLIDDVGLKGYRIGGIKISEQHGNFFINDQKASWQDVIALRDHIQKTISEKYGIQLHEEVKIIS